MIHCTITLHYDLDEMSDASSPGKNFKYMGGVHRDFWSLLFSFLFLHIRELERVDRGNDIHRTWLLGEKGSRLCLDSFCLWRRCVYM